MELGVPKSRRQAPLPDREKTMHFLFRHFIKDQSGVTAIEYGLIAALVAVVIIGAVTALGTSVQSTFNTVANVLP
jgi:pilus assembly protein Flp/PilA